MSGFENLQKTLQSFNDELLRLKTECDGLAANHQTLSDQCVARQAERNQLVAEIEGLRRAQSEGLSDHGGSTSVVDFDNAGKLNRRVWILEQKNASLIANLHGAALQRRLDVDAERAIAAGLRDRIGVLEERIRATQLSVLEKEKRVAELEEVLKTSLVHFEASQINSRRDHEDLSDALREEKKRSTALSDEVEELTADKQVLAEQLRSVQENRTPLQNMPLNVPSNSNRSTASSTPTKSKGGTAHSPANEGKGDTASLNRRYLHLEDRHKALKTEYDVMRARYQEDLRYWKEYKAADDARRLQKQERRKAKREARAGFAAHTHSSGTTAHPTSPVRLPNDLTVPARPRPLVEASDESVPKVGQDASKKTSESESSGLAGGPDRDRPTTSQQSHQSQSLSQTVLLPYSAPNQRVDEPSPPSLPAGRGLNSTPSSSRGLTRLPSRTTPWLGAGTGSTPKAATKKVLEPDDTELDLDDANTSPDSATPVHTPLVRDRGVTASTAIVKDLSLRRAALTRQREDQDTPSVKAESGADLSSGRKRKSLDLEGASPSQKALELKRLNKMSAAEKREYYARYKGKGRYTAPQEVGNGVFEEYEIDPEQNEGVTHQFHDVKRKKTDRKHMHGGDCECCKEYYDAIGQLPRFNQPPAWKDSTADDDAAREHQEHQDKVSRHRETWRKPPTPPGYWHIGFPSTQDVDAQNARADRMVAEREAQVRREAAHKDSKWRKKV